MFILSKQQPKPVLTSRELAEKIARTLFTNGIGKGEVADRLVLELPGKRDGGGWCEKAAADQIERILKGEQ